MNTQIINIQFSVFGDFKDLNPSNPNVVIEFMNMLKNDEFVPSTFGEIPMNTNQIKLYNRFSFSNKDGVTINIGSERLDVVFGYIDDGKYKDMNYDAIYDKALNYIFNIINKYKNIIYRIALNITKIFDENDSKKIEDKFNQSIELDYYKNKDVVEWKERFVCRDKDIFKNDINICLDLNKTIGKFNKKNEVIDFNGVMAIFDINTVFTDIKEEYKEEDIRDFFNIAGNKFKEMDKSIG